MYDFPLNENICFIKHKTIFLQMRQRCREVGLEPSGRREALKRRLKEHFKSEKLIEAGD
jgi:hypothetical protein